MSTKFFFVYLVLRCRLAFMSDKTSNSQNSLADATRSRASFSGHGGLGAAGKREMSFDPDNAAELQEPGKFVAITPGPEGFDEILIGVAWDQIVEDDTGLLGKMFGRKKTRDVDLDIGCLYELEDGTRGAIQAFGEKWGDFEKAPFISLSGDEREGDEEGHDEVLHVNGIHWGQVKRLLIYLYIYDGVPNWSQVNPRVIVDVPGEQDLVVTLGAHEDHLDLCAIGGVENVRGGIKLTNYTEYFPGHEEMDRAFGFGLQWADGKKRRND